MKNNYIVKKDALGRTLFCCPNCNRTLVTFYSEVQSVRTVIECECGEKVYFGEVYEELCIGCSDEKICHEECKHCVQFYERLEELEEEND